MTTQALFREDAYLRECEARVTAVHEAGIELDRTVFYPLGGGQAGDTGCLLRADGTRVRIVDARKSKAPEATPDDVVHVPEPGSALPAVGEVVRAEIDWERRHRMMRFHTASHLLCAVVPHQVDGCAVTDASARLDFVMTEPLEREAVQAGLDRLLATAAAVSLRWITDEEMRANPQLVRSMSVQPPIGFGRVRLVEIAGIDLQPCGGTHVANLAEIGAVRVAKIEKKSAKTRRVTIEFV